ncbi:3898_t:CDS:2, partial [Ambispora leptoticha]
TLNLHKFLLENGVLLNFGDDDTANLQKLVEKFYKPAFSNYYTDMTYRDAIIRVEDVCHKRHMHAYYHTRMDEDQF